MLRRCLMLLLLVQGLTACALFSRDKEKVAEPTELSKISTTAKLVVVWKARTGGDDEQFLNLVPAIDGEKVYTSDYRGQVQALDARTGKSVWKSKTGAFVSGGPGIGDGVVLLGTRNGDVLALDASDGKKIWSAPVTSEVLSIPRVTQGIVGVQTLSGDLVGLDLQTGERRWIYDRSVPSLTLRGTGSPALANGLIVGGFASGKLSAISIANGRTIWETSIAVPRGRSELERMVDIDASPRILGGIVYAVSYQGKVAALDLRDGSMIWARDMSSSAGLGVDNSRVYVTDEESNVWGLQRRNGASLWKQDGLQGRAVTAPVSYGDYIAVGDYEGYIHLISRSDGSFAGRVRVDRDGISATPVVVDDLLYVLGRGGVLAVYKVQQVAPKKIKKNKANKKKKKSSKKESAEL